MHDAAVAYEFDTIVIDVAESYQPAPTEAESDTEDVVVQVYVNGKWHRRMPDLSETSCGIPIDGQRNPPRRFALANDLCTECHTARELVKAATANRKVYEP